MWLCDYVDVVCGVGVGLEYSTIDLFGSRHGENAASSMPADDQDAERQEMSDYKRRQEAMRLITHAKSYEISAFLDSTSIVHTRFSVAPVLPELG